MGPLRLQTEDGKPETANLRLQTERLQTGDCKPETRTANRGCKPNANLKLTRCRPVSAWFANQVAACAFDQFQVCCKRPAFCHGVFDPNRSSPASVPSTRTAAWPKPPTRSCRSPCFSRNLRVWPGGIAVPTCLWAFLYSSACTAPLFTGLWRSLIDQVHRLARQRDTPS